MNDGSLLVSRHGARTTHQKQKKKLTIVMRGEAELGESDAEGIRDRSVFFVVPLGKRRNFL